MIGGHAADSQPPAASCSSSSSSSSPSGRRPRRDRRSRPDILSILRSVVCVNASSADTGRGRSKLSSNKVTHGFHLVEGRSGHDMEDYHVAEYRYENNHELGLFAIYDGHLGYLVANYLKANLFNNILKEPLFWSDPQEGIKSAYRSTNKYILENSKQLGPGGSTAVTAIVVDGIDMWIANIGDSRAVVCERGTAKQLTVDHEPHTTNERKRIEEHGGFVSRFPGDVPRVNGQLAVARAFGDQSLKAHLSSEPDVKHIQINSSTEFVILASDGLWKDCLLNALTLLGKGNEKPRSRRSGEVNEGPTNVSKAIDIRGPHEDEQGRYLVHRDPFPVLSLAYSHSDPGSSASRRRCELRFAVSSSRVPDPCKLWLVAPGPIVVDQDWMFSVW